jgi:hypothetical protein
MLNPLIDKSIKLFLDLLYSISPEKYADNIINYSSFKEYFQNINTENQILIAPR